MKRLVTMLSAGVAALVLSAGALAADPVVVTPAQIDAAKTPADHEAIAAAYDTEATRLEGMAQQHESMANSYKSTSSKKGMGSAAMNAHCAKLAKLYGDAAMENRDLAAEHRKMAVDAGHSEHH